MSDISSKAQAEFGYTQFLRRDFHMHPELGFQEIRTAGIVAKELTNLGLQVSTGIAGTGVAALLRGGKPGPVILLRADMDALPIVEETGVEYASQTKGVMHACGHDAHTAILLTVARLLCNYRDKLNGTVKFIFQPAEEGMGGAEKMIKGGVLENPRPDVVLALHVWNEMPVGWIRIASGPVMAGAEIFKIKVIGKGGHGAAPHLATDPILASSQIVNALQGIVSRNVPPLQTAVISVCTIHGGEIFNVIPPVVEMSGTIRTFDAAVRSTVLARFKKTINATAEAMDCRAEIDLQRLTPATVNDPFVVERVQNTARKLFPDADIITSSHITMGSEDFAFFLEKIPGCFFFIGTANTERGLDAAHHHPKFDIDETALPCAVALMTGAVIDYLSGN